MPSQKPPTCECWLCSKKHTVQTCNRSVYNALLVFWVLAVLLANRCRFAGQALHVWTKLVSLLPCVRQILRCCKTPSCHNSAWSSRHITSRSKAHEAGNHLMVYAPRAELAWEHDTLLRTSCQQIYCIQLGSWLQCASVLCFPTTPHADDVSK